MRKQKQAEHTWCAEEEHALDLVVPFTNSRLTDYALKYAGALGKGLGAQIRLLRIAVLPFPLDSGHSPVSRAFLKEQMMSFRSTLPVQTEVLVTRDFMTELSTRIRRESIVILASRRRIWQTRTERIAAALGRAGHTVLLVYEETNHA